MSEPAARSPVPQACAGGRAGPPQAPRGGRRAWGRRRAQGGAAGWDRTGADSAAPLPGNLLSSLMGSSEQEGEDSQDDSSPIELD